MRLSWHNRFAFHVFLGVAIAALLPENSANADQPAIGKQVEKVLNSSKGQRINYLFFLPSNYREAKKPLPLILFLHGSGERGEGNLPLVKMHGPPKIVETKPDFPFIVVSPQCPKGVNWLDPDQMSHLNELLDFVIANYRVDASRVYLTGLSMGGAGSWGLAAARPERFAVVVPMCAGGNTDDVAKLKSLPIWYFLGAKDREQTVVASEKMIAALKSAGANVKYSLYPDLGHNCWTRAYDDPELYKWLMTHTSPKSKSK